MASRPLFTPYPVIVNGDMSGNLTSKITQIPNLSLLSYSVVWSGTSPAGTVSVQVSNDYTTDAAGTIKNPGTWNTLPLDSATPVSGSTGNGFIDIDLNAAFAVRLVYTRISGTGILNVVVNGKVS